MGPIRIGVPELLIILIVVLLIFGPKNLPKLGSALGKTIKGLRDGMGAGKKEASEATDAKEEAPDEVVVEDVQDKQPAEQSKKTVKRVVVKKAE